MNPASMFLTTYLAHSTDEGQTWAIAREKQIKGWLRSRKISLIESVNPTWDDLSVSWFEEKKER
jgi:predicted GIY-YIG superfamily endonuclease